VNDEPRKKQGGLSIKTLLIAGAASATAAFVVPKFWEPGTVFAAAMTPVIVTVVSELLKRPVETVSAVTTRKTTGGAVLIDPPPEEPFDPLAPISAEELEAVPETTTQRAVHKRRPLTPRQWKLALVTGLVAFACAVFVVTATELLAGEQVGGGDNSTTFFSGSRRQNRDKEATPSPTATATPQDEQATPTPAPSTTATPTPTPTATPTATPTPAVESAPAPLSEEPTATPTPTP
jgi:hypothetical protein